MRTKRDIIIFIISIMVLLSGCSMARNIISGDDSYANKSLPSGVMYDFAPDSSFMLAESAPNMMLRDSAAYQESTTDITAETSSADRLVIRNANMSIRELDTTQTIENISKIAGQFGGFVVQSNTWLEAYYSGVDLPHGSITIRVKAENFDTAIAMIESNVPDPEENVISKDISGKDITSEYVDSSSKLTSLEATQKKLYEILDTSKKVEDTLNVYREISNIETQIEVLKGQLKYMEESAALSSIVVNIQPIKPEKEIEIKKWSLTTIVKNAIQDLIDGLQIFGEGLIYFVISVLPFLLIISVPIFFILRAIIRKIRKSSANKKNSTEFDDLNKLDQ